MKIDVMYTTHSAWEGGATNHTTSAVLQSTSLLNHLAGLPGNEMKTSGHFVAFK
jgi:hypothetical protein